MEHLSSKLQIEKVNELISRFDSKRYWKSAEETNSLLIELCDYYLSTRDEQRKKLRDIIKLYNNLSGYLVCDFARKASMEILISGEKEWLRRGLAAISIENCRFDYRDSILSLNFICRAARGCDLDPMPFVKEMEILSSHEKPYSNVKNIPSGSELFSNFDGYKIYINW